MVIEIFEITMCAHCKLFFLYITQKNKKKKKVKKNSLVENVKKKEKKSILRTFDGFIACVQKTKQQQKKSPSYYKNKERNYSRSRSIKHIYLTFLIFRFTFIHSFKIQSWGFFFLFFWFPYHPSFSYAYFSRHDIFVE